MLAACELPDYIKSRHPGALLREDHLPHEGYWEPVPEDQYNGLDLSQAPADVLLDNVDCSMVDGVLHVYVDGVAGAPPRYFKFVRV